jgi:ATP-dependent RNA helicase RhlE
VDDLTHVINYEIPNVAETYVHRIGRTGRAGASGIAISFCEAEEVSYIKDIQKLTGLIIPQGEDRGQLPKPSFDITRGVPAPPEHSGRGQRQGQGQRHGAPRQGGGGGRKPNNHRGQHSRSNDGRNGENRNKTEQRAGNTKSANSGAAPATNAGDSTPKKKSWSSFFKRSS